MDRIPEGARFSVPVQTGRVRKIEYLNCQGPTQPPIQWAMGTGSFPGLKRPGRGVDHPTPSSAEVKERVELYLYSISGPSWPVIG